MLPIVSYETASFLLTKQSIDFHINGEMIDISIRESELFTLCQTVILLHRSDGVKSSTSSDLTFYCKRPN